MKGIEATGQGRMGGCRLDATDGRMNDSSVCRSMLRASTTASVKICMAMTRQSPTRLSVEWLCRVNPSGCVASIHRAVSHQSIGLCRINPSGCVASIHRGCIPRQGPTALHRRLEDHSLRSLQGFEETQVQSSMERSMERSMEQRSMACFFLNIQWVRWDT